MNIHSILNIFEYLNKYSYGYSFQLWIFNKNNHEYLFKYSFSLMLELGCSFQFELFNEIFFGLILEILNIHMNVRFCL